MPPTFSQPFQNNLNGWMAQTVDGDGPANLVLSLESGHAHLEPGNSYPPDNDPTAFSRLDGYSSVFPAGGFDLSLDVLLDLDETEGDTGFAYTAGASRSDNCLHQRDFAFWVGTSSDASQFCVGFHNGVDPNNTINACSGDDHLVLTGESGWYTFVHQFRDNAGVLAVTMIVRGPDGTVVGSATKSTPADTMDIVGGNRYAWLALVKNPAGIDIRNSLRTSL